MSRKSERRNEEEHARVALRELLGDSFKEVEFFYYRKTKGVFVTYEDFKPEAEVVPLVQEAVGSEWKVVLKREFSDLTVMLTMLRLYKKNRIAVVDIEDGELRPYQVREYVNRLMEKQ